MSWFLLAAGLLVAAPAAVVTFECLLALLPLRRINVTKEGSNPSVAVIVPAHNEQSAVGGTVRAMLTQLGPKDRLIVVADNCNDETAREAFDAGAQVLTRTDAEKRGKGYAIQFAIDRLQDNPPDVLMVVDADCQMSAGSVALLSRAARQFQRPVQSAYTMAPHAKGGSKSAVSSLAVLIKNYVRPRGLQYARMPCVLTGSGMAFPWKAIQETEQRHSHIVEDMAYTADLALAGFPPMPCMEARTTSELPSIDAAFQSQRTRWEHGHLMTIASEAPRLLLGFLRTGRVGLLLLLCEMAVPPLTLLIAGLGVASVVLTSIGLATAAIASLVPFGLLVIACAASLLFAWLAFGREVLPAAQIASVPRYVLAKAPIYRRFLVDPQQTWERTQRDPHVAGNSASGAMPKADTGAGRGVP